MHELSTLAAFWFAFSLALLSPGPNVAVLAGTAVRDGRQRALATAVGLAGGELVWAVAAVFGVSALAAQHPWVATGLRWGGGALLLWLGVGALRSAWKPSVEAAPAAAPAGSGVARGFGLMLLNPKAGVFWVSLSSVFLGTALQPGMAALAVAGAVAMSLAWHGALAWALSAGPVARGLARMRRGFDAALGAVLTALGVKLLASP